MKIALLQLRLDPVSRSSNLSRALRMLDRACAQDPSPDLLVFPEACDGRSPGAPHAAMTRAMASGFSESFAAKAREWGVYVAGGFHQAADDGAVSVATLYDPDGDAVLCCPRDAGAGSSSDRETGSLCVRKTPLGIWGLCLGSQCEEDGILERLAAAEARVLIVPAVSGAGPDTMAEQRWVDLSKRLMVFTCLAAGIVAGTESAGRSGSRETGSFVCGPDGRMIARGSTPREQVVFAELAGV